MFRIDGLLYDSNENNNLQINNLNYGNLAEITSHLDRQSLAKFLSTNKYFFNEVNNNITIQNTWKNKQAEQSDEFKTEFNNADQIISDKKDTHLSTTAYLRLLSCLKKHKKYSSLLLAEQKKFSENSLTSDKGKCLDGITSSMTGMIIGGLSTGILTQSLSLGLAGAIGGTVIGVFAPPVFYKAKYLYLEHNTLKAEKDVSNTINQDTIKQSNYDVVNEETALISPPKNKTPMLAKFFSCFAKQADVESLDVSVEEIVVDANIPRT